MVNTTTSLLIIISINSWWHIGYILLRPYDLPYDLLWRPCSKLNLICEPWMQALALARHNMMSLTDHSWEMRALREECEKGEQKPKSTSADASWWHWNTSVQSYYGTLYELPRTFILWAWMQACGIQDNFILSKIFTALSRPLSSDYICMHAALKTNLVSVQSSIRLVSCVVDQSRTLMWIEYTPRRSRISSTCRDAQP